MEVLFTGNLGPLSNSFFQSMTGDLRKVVCGKNIGRDWEGKNLTPYDFAPGTEEFRNIFKTFNFDACVYISKALNGVPKVFDELEGLEHSLSHSKENQVKNFIYITTNDYIENKEIKNTFNNRFILLQACEQLCQSYARDSNMNVTVIRLPYLYNTEHFETKLGQWIQDGIRKNEICLPGSMETVVDFLSEEDLSILISRILDEPGHGYTTMNLTGDSRTTFAEIVQRLQKHKESIRVTYQSMPEAIPQMIKDTHARTEYGWFPTIDFDRSFEELIQKCNTLTNQNKKKRQIKVANSKVKNIFTSMAELLALFVFMLFLNKWVAGNAKLSFFDFRLLFVVLLGTMRGLYMGIIAAFCACVSYILNVSNGVDWQITFYNIQNWLPFAVYFLVGAISGYSRDKNQDQLHFTMKEQELLENKYVFLSELYAKALQNKDEFNNQIISYNNSYGRIYDMVKRLNTTLPDQVFYEAIQITEDALSNAYVAIYTVDENSDFARLNVCSKVLNATLSKSLRMSDYPEMLENLRKNETWINTLCLPDYPIYATPIFRDDQIAGLILLMKTTYQQMSMDYANKFNIVTGLIKDSLLRAMERTKLMEKDTMLANTKILNKESFKKVLEIKKQMKESDFSEYLLIKLQYENITLTELSETVSQMVRNQDVLGQGEDGNVYLLLSQTNNKYISLIAERLAKKQISFTIE